MDMKASAFVSVVDLRWCIRGEGAQIVYRLYHGNYRIRGGDRGLEWIIGLVARMPIFRVPDFPGLDPMLNGFFVQGLVYTVHFGQACYLVDI